MGLLPREHGAYGQMIAPIVTSFAVAGVTLPAVLVALAAVAGFLAHEPLLVVAGLRGMRAKREHAHQAALWLATTLGVAAGAGVAALWVLPPPLRRSLLLPLVPAALLAGAIAGRREKSTGGEIAAALVFSLTAFPICRAAGASADTSFAVAGAFAAIFVACTLAVRVVVLETRAGGDRRAALRTRAAVIAVTAAASVALIAAARSALLPWTALAAATPGLLAAVWLAMHPPPPTRLRAVGWMLVSASAAAAVILLAGLAGRR